MSLRYFVDDRDRRSRVDHQGGVLVVNRGRNEKMITESPLQFRTSEALPGKKSGKGTWRRLRFCGEGRERLNP